MPKILLVDDDAELTAMLAEYLATEGCTVAVAGDGVEGAARALDGDCDLVVLDVMLPGRNGIETLRAIRAASNVPVLMLTARGDEIDKVVGLELGADDYVSKPCTPRELAARVRAILRRTLRHAAVTVAGETTSPSSAAGAAEPLVAGALRVWPRSRRAEWRNLPLALTSTQYGVLEALVRHAGTVVSKAELSRLALGRPLGRFDRSIDVHVGTLRQKLGGPGGGDALIKTVRGIGYQLTVG